MLKEVDIENLRGIGEGSLKDLTEVNVIVGPNNAGKSTILDAIVLGASPSEDAAFSRVLDRRRVSPAGKWLVRNAGRKQLEVASVRVKTDRGTERVAEVVVQPDGGAIFGSPNHAPVSAHLTKRPKGSAGGKILYPFHTLQGVEAVRLIDPLTNGRVTQLYELYTKVVEAGLRKQAKDLVKAVIPNLEDIEILTTAQNQPVLYLVFPDYAHPVELAGDGIVLLLKFVFELAACTGGIALLEEPETHLHPAAIKQCVRAIWAAVKRGVQIILTTHSLDLIDLLLSVDDEGDLGKVSIFRVQLEKGVLKSHRLSGKDALLARTQIEDDLR